MSKVPSLSYTQVIAALRRDGWVVVRQRGSHIRLQKGTPSETLKIIVPAHRPIKRSTLSHILKHARLSVGEFAELLQAGQHLHPGERALPAAFASGPVRRLIQDVGL